MKIGELSERTGVSIPTIRVYEREGLISLAERTDGRFRVFGEEQRIRLEFIKMLRSFGFSMEDVRDLISLSDAGLTTVSRDRADWIARAVDEKLRNIQKLALRLSNALSGQQPFESLERVFSEL